MRSINLLPPESRKKAGVRRRQGLWVLLGLAYVALLVAATFWFQGRVGEARDDLEAQEAVVAQVQREIDELADLESLRVGFETRVAVVDGILARDIAWGRLLNDLARMIPPRVWLGSFNGSADPPDSPIVGQLTMTGTGFDYTDVASWLRALESTNFPGVDDTWVSTITTGEIGSAEIVDFSSSTALTDAALSTRAAERIPDLP